ncbi:MAG: 23S rRNA (guanosine(2251)-2'-O)-methyltransferase RlmB [Myxococcales bacterium]|nr:23S rRNA (guanosine(2251)-2'-O)-methyltransferase RlmB [Myxococcales bacterium]
MYGVGPVRELLAAKPDAVRRLYIEPRRGDQASDDVGQLLIKARELGLSTEMADKAMLTAIAGEFALHQGVIAVVAPFVFAELADIMARAADRGEALLVVVLDQVQDPHNVGAIIRTAYLMGAHGVVVPVHRQSSITATVTKASAGATELLPIAQVTNVVRALEEFKAAGAWVIGLDAPAPMSLHQIDGTLPLVLVAGAEGDGIRPLVAKQCDFIVELPMHAAGVGSYNVSVATAMALYEIVRGRRG